MPESNFGTIAVGFDALRAGYPTYNALPPHIKKYMDDLNKGRAEGAPKNTPCCFQVSEALNVVGGEHAITERSYRRVNAKLLGNRYLGAVDELEYYLAGRYGKGEDIKPQAKGSAHPIAAMKDYIAGRQGILTFRDAGYGAHTELWDGTDILQNGAPLANGAGMNQSYCFGQPRILFWQCIGDDGLDEAPVWVQGWWDVNDGNQWYYHFSSQYVVSYIEKKPNNPFDMPTYRPGSEGRYAVDPVLQTVTIVWKPMGDGVTLETFNLTGFDFSAMAGISNRYAPLTATKITDFSTKRR